MDNPPYIVVDEMATVVEAARLALKEAAGGVGWDVLNYQYGYITELAETLQQWEETQEWREKKYPLVWLRQPFTIKRGEPNYYGTIPDLTLFIMNRTDVNYKAAQRMELNFKPILHPIYRELVKQIDLSVAFDFEDYTPDLEETDFYYWGDEEKSYLSEIVDCLRLQNFVIKLNNNPNCSTFTNLLI